MIRVAKEISKVHDKEKIYLKVLSPDTDVFVLAIYHFASLPNSQEIELVFDLNITKRRVISINKCVNTLGVPKSLALPGLHAYSGCDQIGKMFYISKSKIVKQYLALDNDSHIVKAFQDLALNSDPESFNKPIMEFTMSIYSKHHDEAVKDIGALRWFLFSKHNYDSERLPPTWGALKHHILRAHCVSSTWVKCVHEFSPTLPKPTQCGWTIESEETQFLTAVMTDELPARAATIDMGHNRLWV